MIGNLMEAGVTSGVFPSAQLVVAHKKEHWSWAVGSISRELGQKHRIHNGTRYDIASLTKPLCTSVLAMQAVAEGTLDLKQPLAL